MTVQAGPRLTGILRDARWLRVALMVVVAVSLAFLFVVLRNESWVADDNLFLELARRQGFNLDWLLSLRFQHWGIAYNLLYTLLLHLFPLDYRWALVLMLLMLGASAFLLQRIIALLYGTPRLGLLVAGWFVLSPLFVRPLQWFAAGGQIIPATFFDLLCLYGWLVFRAEGSRRWLVGSWAALVAGLLFYEKPAFMPVYLVLIRVLFMAELRPADLMRSFWRERVQWGVYIGIAGIWLVAYLSRHPHLGAGPVTIPQYLSYFRIFWFNTLVPSGLGVSVPAGHLTMMQTLFVTLAEISVLVVLAVSIRRARRAWRGWAFLVVCVLMIGVLVAHSRVAQFGVQIANDTRYQFELAWLVPLAICFAFRPTAPLRLRRRVDLRAAELPPLRLGALAAVCLLSAAYLVGSTATAENFVASWPGEAARAWQEHLRAGLQASEHAGRKLVIADNTTPEFIVASPFTPFNVLSQQIPLYDAHAQVDGPLTGSLARVDPQGNIRPAAFGPPIGDGSVPALLGAGSLTAPGNAKHAPGLGVCLATIRQPISLERRMPARARSGAGPYYLRLAYRARRPVTASVAVDYGAGYRTDPLKVLALPPQASGAIWWLGVSSPRRLELVLTRGGAICVSRLDVVGLLGHS